MPGLVIKEARALAQNPISLIFHNSILIFLRFTQFFIFLLTVAILLVKEGNNCFVSKPQKNIRYVAEETGYQ